MKTYKQFLYEQWKYNDEDGEMQHTAHVKGHHVVTTANQESGHHEIGFRVNGSYRDSGVVSVEDSPSIVRHVTRTVNDYVSQYKPNEIRFSAYNSSHQEGFGKYAKHLAKKHGYSHKTRKDTLFGGNLHILKKVKE